MFLLESGLAGTETDFAMARRELERLGFSIGGNWNYEGGCFDCRLAGESSAWLRLPFRVVSGEMDAETQDPEARIRFGEPFVLNHEVQLGPDPGADSLADGGLFNQFQTPANPDAEVTPEMAAKARQLLGQVEQALGRFVS